MQGYLTRKRYPRKEMIKSIWTIQAHMRKYALRKKFEKLLQEKKAKMDRDVKPSLDL